MWRCCGVSLVREVKNWGFEARSFAITISDCGPRPEWQPVLTHTSFSSLRCRAKYGPSSFILFTNLFASSSIHGWNLKASKATYIYNLDVKPSTRIKFFKIFFYYVECYKYDCSHLASQLLQIRGKVLGESRIKSSKKQDTARAELSYNNCVQTRSAEALEKLIKQLFLFNDMHVNHNIFKLA